ncbi:MAG: DUF1254 domain-containing protein, partial [Novosphingobium sp.]
ASAELAAPLNAFHHNLAFPSGNFRAVVRPNFDTLYSSAWLDLADGPVELTIGDTKGRYYLLPVYDMWTDTFAVPGSETLPAGQRVRFAITAPGWHGTLPTGTRQIVSPTRYAWIIGRIQTNGPEDYSFVHSIQQQIALSPLGHVHAARTALQRNPWPNRAEPAVDTRTTPVAIVNAMSAAEFFETALRLLADNPPHIFDQAQVARLELLGLKPGATFNRLPGEVQEALAQAKDQGPSRLLRHALRSGQERGGWRLSTLSVGTYGTDYLQRAAVAMTGLGANRPFDSIYPRTVRDSDGKPLTGTQHYRIHFEAGKLPPARAFWSLTAYTPDGYTEPNAVNRYAIGDRDSLVFNPDGSLDLLLQADAPDAAQRANWLPVPPGAFNLSLRIYRPTTEAIEGDWTPPAVERTAPAAAR